MADGVVLELRTDADGWSAAAPDLAVVAKRAVTAAAAKTGAQGEVSILFTDDKAMQALNAQWRGKDAPTDVLSFPGDPAQTDGAPFLGDIALGLEIVQRDADALGRPIDLHISHLLVHGFLHLLGYDHGKESEARVMEALEADILTELGLPDPYGDAA